MKSEVRARYIVFDAVQIDVVGRRLTVDGNEIALEPKAFDVLMLLASHPGKAFARDEILDAVWGHRHITPGVLNRVVTLIRHALGGGSERDPYIRTLHGVGYRFDAQVRLIDEAERPIEASAREEIVTTTQLTPTTTPIEQEANPVVKAAPATIADVITAPAPAIEPVRVPPRSHKYLLAFALAAAAVILGVILWHYAGREGASTTATSAVPTLVVLPLHAVGGDKDTISLAEGLNEELITDLASVQGLRVIANTSAIRAQREGFDPPQLAQNLHVTHALEGSLRQAGDTVRIDLRLLETPSGQTIWTQGYDRKSADVFAVQRQIAQAVASALSLRMGLARASPGNVDPQVLREYLELHRIFYSSNDSAVWNAALERLRELVARAPDFAPARGLLAANIAHNPAEAEHRDEAPGEAMRAIASDPNTFYAYQALGDLACQRYDWSECMKQFNTALAINPGDPIVQLNAGMWLAGLGYREEALGHFENAYAIDPLSYWTCANLGTMLDVLGRHDEAKRHLDTLLTLETKPQQLTQILRWNNAIWRRDFAAARAIVAQMPDQTWSELYAEVIDASSDPALWPRADAAMTVEEQKRGGSKDWLRLWQPQPDATRLYALFDGKGSSSPFSMKLLWADDYAGIRRDRAFSDFLKRTRMIDYWRSKGWPKQCRPDSDGVICD